MDFRETASADESDAVWGIPYLREVVSHLPQLAIIRFVGRAISRNRMLLVRVHEAGASLTLPVADDAGGTPPRHAQRTRHGVA